MTIGRFAVGASWACAALGAAVFYLLWFGRWTNAEEPLTVNLLYYVLPSLFAAGVVAATIAVRRRARGAILAAVVNGLAGAYVVAAVL